MFWRRNVIIQDLTDDTLLCHPIPPQSREGSPCSQYPSIKCIQTCVCVLASGGKVWVGGGERNGWLIGWGLGASHPVPQGLRRIVLCLFTGYVSGSGSWMSMEAPSTASQSLSGGSDLGLPGLAEVTFSPKTEWGGVSSTPFPNDYPILKPCSFCPFPSSPGAEVHPSPLQSYPLASALPDPVCSFLVCLLTPCILLLVPSISAGAEPCLLVYLPHGMCHHVPPHSSCLGVR